MTPTFEFDPDKSTANLAKHGIDFIEAQRLWADPCRLTRRLPYPGEERWMAVAQHDGKHWSAVVTFRSNVVRLISVRRSREEEIRTYERKAQDNRRV